MKKITLLICFAFVSYNSFSQCTNSTENSSVASTNDGFLQTLATNVDLTNPTEYVTVTGLIVGHNYKFISTHGNPEVQDFITVTDLSDNPVVNGVGSSPLTINNFQNTSVRVHVRTDNACNTDAFFHKVSLIDLTVEPTTCHKPTYVTTSVLTYRSDTRMDITWNAPEYSTPEGYEVEFVPQGAGASFSGSTVAPITSISTGEGALTPDTVYDISIRSTCGVNGNSAYTTLSIKTNLNPPPLNDFCGDAFTIVQQSGIPNAGSASPTPGTILGGAGTNRVAEDCNGFTGNARDDVWYKFVAKTTDVNIRVEPNGFDAVVNLYSGNCNSLSELACSDGSFSGGSEELYYSGLTIGNTYYARTYHFSGTTPTNPAPTFDIKIWSTTAATDADNDGYVASLDCNDNNASIYPGAPEVTGNGIDENCDTMFTWYQDSDSDGYGSTVVVTSANSSPGAGESNNSTDCNDGNASIHPGATEVTANGIDENCDGMFTWYQDLDGDGYGTTTVVMSANSTPGAGESNLSTDCDDTRVGVNPGATEIEGNGLDDDCNPATPDMPLGIDDFDLNKIRIVPNPFTEKITIYLPTGYGNEKFDTFIYDINGRAILSTLSESENGTIVIGNLNALHQGLYFIKISSKSDGKSIVRELIKY